MPRHLEGGRLEPAVGDKLLVTKTDKDRKQGGDYYKNLPIEDVDAATNDVVIQVGDTRQRVGRALIMNLTEDGALPDTEWIFTTDPQALAAERSLQSA